VLDTILEFIQAHKLYFDAAHALSSVVNLLGWTLGAIFVYAAWRRNGITSVSLGPFNVRMREEAIAAAVTADRDWQAKVPSRPVNVDRIRATVGKAFEPEIADNLIGKSVLWVDDNPANNVLAMRALTKLRLDVEQVTSTELGLSAMQRRHFDLVISDMGRNDNMRAGYDLLSAIRATGNQVPFLIFAGSDSPAFRAEATARGAQLSTNDVLELIDHIIKYLGR
jgi:CheY-like chemotaxis protein